MPQSGNQWERENDITSQLKSALWLKIVDGYVCEQM